MKKYPLIFLCFIVLFSCSDADLHNVQEAQITTKSKNITNYYADQEQLEKLLPKLQSIFKGSSFKINALSSNNDDINDLYVVNFDKGFLIMPSDKRIFPVLGFSFENNFDLGADVFPNGLVDWLAYNSNLVKNYREDETSVLFDEDHWDEQYILKYLKSAKHPSDLKKSDNQKYLPCGIVIPTHISEQINPFLTSRWGQGVGYNNLAHNLGCSSNSNGKAPTGCVATAMGQIIRYHQFPVNYNYGVMPNILFSASSSGASEVSQLLFDVGDAVNMDYGCDGSGASTQSEVASSFINDFDYSSANYTSYFGGINGSPSTDEYNAASEIRNGFPIIFRGGKREKQWLFFNTYTNGHAWVADGFIQNRGTIFLPGGGGMQPGPYCFEFHSFHMNWGWNGSFNGYFANNSWNPSSFSFNYERGMVHKIRP